MAKHCIYIIIVSILSAKELIFYIPQEASRCSAPYRHRKMTYIVRKRIFARCGRAARAKRDSFFMDRFLLSRRFQRGITRPWEGSGSVFSSGRTDGRTQGSREGEETLPKYIYRYYETKTSQDDFEINLPFQCQNDFLMYLHLYVCIDSVCYGCHLGHFLFPFHGKNVHYKTSIYFYG